jgi:hypothetical protein
VRLADGHVHPVVGKGTVNVQTPSGEIKSIYEFHMYLVLVKGFF